MISSWPKVEGVYFRKLGGCISVVKHTDPFFCRNLSSRPKKKMIHSSLNVTITVNMATFYMLGNNSSLRRHIRCWMSSNLHSWVAAIFWAGVLPRRVLTCNFQISENSITTKGISFKLSAQSLREVKCVCIEREQLTPLRLPKGA